MIVLSIRFYKNMKSLIKFKYLQEISVKIHLLNFHPNSHLFIIKTILCQNKSIRKFFSQCNADIFWRIAFFRLFLYLTEKITHNKD